MYFAIKMKKNLQGRRNNTSEEVLDGSYRLNYSFSILKMEAARSSETSVLTDGILQHRNKIL
jgi:hypothetical protein